jgi:hypothetical protein
MMLYYMQYTIGSPLGVEEHSAAEIGLSAFPNPFRDNTQIVYELRQNSTVSVDVFDMLGNKVASLADHESQQAGKHQLGLGSAHGTSGIYFVKVTIDGISYVQRIVETN